MKNILLIILILFPFLSYSQQWTAIANAPSQSGHLGQYNSNLLMGTNYAWQWNGSTWDTIGGKFNGYINAFAEYNGELYAGGSFTASGTSTGLNNIAKWNGTNWVSLGTGISGGVVNDLKFLNNDLYACGTFTSAGGNNAMKIAKWNGLQWDSLNIGLNNSALKMQVANNHLYVLGYFTQAGSVSAHYIAAWDGSVWTALQSGITLSNTSYYGVSMVSFNGNIYVSDGWLQSAGSVNFPNYEGAAVWDGTSWQAMPAGAGMGYSLYMATSVNNLYALGDINDGRVYLLSGNTMVQQNYNYSSLDTAFISDIIFLNNHLYIVGQVYMNGFHKQPMAQINLPSVLGITNSVQADDIKIYPNPSSDFVNLETSGKDAEAILYNIQGKEMRRVSCNGQDCQLSVKDISAGIYFIEIRKENTVLVKQLSVFH
jgi:hypothetical protein